MTVILSLSLSFKCNRRNDKMIFKLTIWWTSRKLTSKCFDGLKERKIMHIVFKYNGVKQEFIK